MTNPTRQLTAETLGLEVLDALQYELDKVPEFVALPTMRKDEVAARLKVTAERVVRESILCLVGESFPACAGVLSSISFGDAIKAGLKLAKDDAHRHDLADAVGRSVVIVIAEPEAYLQRMERIAADPQGELFKGVGETAGEIRQSVDAHSHAGEEPAWETDFARAICATCSHTVEHHKNSPAESGSACSVDECACDTFVLYIDTGEYFPCFDCGHSHASHTPTLSSDGSGHAQCMEDACPCLNYRAPPTSPTVYTEPDAPTEGAAPSESALTDMATVRAALGDALAQIGITVQEDFVAKLTDAQARAALEYATRKLAYPQTRLKRPFYLPAPSAAPSP